MKITSKIIEARKGGNGRKRVTMSPLHHSQTPKTHQQIPLQNKTRKNKITYIYIYIYMIMNVFFFFLVFDSLTFSFPLPLFFFPLFFLVVFSPLM
jgi:hypothetical protein